LIIEAMCAPNEEIALANANIECGDDDPFTVGYSGTGSFVRVNLSTSRAREQPRHTVTKRSEYSSVCLGLEPHENASPYHLCRWGKRQAFRT
jgi:hypothetical protein